jgi:PAS domain S-box-containing protein
MRLREVVESLNEGFVYYDAEDRLSLCNAKYREIYATSADLLEVGRTFEDIIREGARRGQYHEAVGRVDEWVAERLARRRRDEVAHEQPLQDGRWILVSDRRTRDGGMVGIRMDITELKRREVELADAGLQLQQQAGEMRRLAREAEAARALLFDAIESVDEGFSIYDAEDRLVVYNQRYADLHPMLGERLRLGISFYEVILAVARSGAVPGVTDPDAFARERTEARRTADLRQFEERHGGLWLRISNRPTRSGGVVSLFADITELKTVQEQLRLSQDRLRATVDSALDPIIVMDGQGRVIEYNPAAARSFGYSRERAIGRMLGPLIVPERYREAHRKGMERYHATGHGPVLRKRIEIEALRADGSEFPVELAIDVAQGEDGEIFVAFLRDITERRGAEAALRDAKERAEQANRAKSTFLAMMSHEIRTPLNGVLGALGLLAEGEFAGEDRHLLDTARDSAQALLVLLNDLLDFSKIEAGKLSLEPVVFRPAELVQSVIDLFAIQAGAKSLRLQVALDPAVPAWVRGDAGRVRQMLMNYVSNAVKFTSAGEIAVTVTATPRGDGAMLRFAVTDTGIGIAERHAHDVFRDFSQLDQSISRRFGGTGLGLAITRRLAELMGGEVGFSSELGAGSRFWFDVPLARADAPVGPGAADVRRARASDAPIHRLRILVAEDNATNQLVVRNMLQRLGCHVDVVGDGAEAVRAATVHGYDLILMDIHMPEMDGIEATRRLRELDRTLPIVALTADAGAEERERYLGAGIDDCLLKPISMESLRILLSGMEPSGASRRRTSVDRPGFDRSVIERMTAEIGETACAAVIEAAQGDIARLTASCLSALQAKDRTGLGRSAHALAGVAASVGATALGGLARGLERAEPAGINPADLQRTSDEALSVLRTHSQAAVTAVAVGSREGGPRARK